MTFRTAAQRMSRMGIRFGLATEDDILEELKYKSGRVMAYPAKRFMAEGDRPKQRYPGEGGCRRKGRGRLLLLLAVGVVVLVAVVVALGLPVHGLAANRIHFRRCYALVCTLDRLSGTGVPVWTWSEDGRNWGLV